MVMGWNQGRGRFVVYTDEDDLEVKLCFKYGPPDTTYHAESRGGVYAWHWITSDTREQVEAVLGQEITPHETDQSRAQRGIEFAEYSQ